MNHIFCGFGGSFPKSDELIQIMSSHERLKAKRSWPAESNKSQSFVSFRCRQQIIVSVGLFSSFRCDQFCACSASLLILLDIILQRYIHIGERNSNPPGAGYKQTSLPSFLVKPCYPCPFLSAGSLV